MWSWVFSNIYLYYEVCLLTIFRCACKCSFHQWKGNSVGVWPMLCLSSLYFFNKIKCNMSRMILWFYLHGCLIIPCWCLYLLEFMSFIALRCWLRFKFNALFVNQGVMRWRSFMELHEMLVSSNIKLSIGVASWHTCILYHLENMKPWREWKYGLWAILVCTCPNTGHFISHFLIRFCT